LYGGHGHGYGGYGHRLYGGYGHYTPYYGYSYWPGYGHYGYGDSGYGSSYGLYGSGLYGHRYSAAYPPTSDSLADVSSGGASNVAPGQDYLSLAENAFRAGDYAEAARLANHAVVETPRNGRLFLFVSQALFATGDYQGATAALYQATTLLEPKDWGHVVENFRNYYRNDDYTRQMERLTKFIEDNPNAAYARTLRGYHYGFLGYKGPAGRDLAKAVELEKRDKLAAQLLQRFGGEPPADRPASGERDVQDDVSEPVEQHGEHDHHHQKTTE
jgi:tetratricopeptide (TPR) repeat protein